MLMLSYTEICPTGTFSSKERPNPDGDYPQNPEPLINFSDQG
jgi:hypothetical protein